MIHRHKELCQLAGVWDFATVPQGGCMAETKVDGWRALYLLDWQGKRGLFTRNGHRINGVGHILHRLALIEQCAGTPLVFDGEYQVNGCLSATKTWCERGWKTGQEAGTLHLFDAMPLADWKAGGSSAPLYQRKAALARWVEQADQAPLAWEWRAGTRGKEPAGDAVTMVQDEWCGSVADVMALARRVWMAGGEGLMLKDAESNYIRERSPAWLKVKSSAYVAR
jgi:ATP-dependent DNA ligase